MSAPSPNGTLFRTVAFWLQAGVLGISVGLMGFALHRDQEFQQVKWELANHEAAPWHGEAGKRYDRQDAAIAALEKSVVQLTDMGGRYEQEIADLREEVRRLRGERGR